MKRHVWSISVGVFLASGCASVAPSQVGQMAGTIAGSAIAPGIGAPLGSLVGMLAGLLVEGQVDRHREKQERADLSRELGTGSKAASPALTGTPTRVWVDEHLEDGRLVAGHFEVRPIP